MRVAILVYNGITAAEAIGPFEVFRRVPDLDVSFVARRPGPHSAHGRPGMLVATDALEDCTVPDIVVVPGGFGTRRLMRDKALVEWVAGAHTTSQWTTSVSTGSLLLGAAGVLRGIEATTHWLVLDELEAFGAVARSERLVARGRVVTASGSAGGIELAEHVVRRSEGEEVAAAIRRSMTADVHRPFGARPTPLGSERPRVLASAATVAGPYVVAEDVPRRRWSRRGTAV